MPDKKPLMTKKEKHRIELLIIILIVTVLINVALYFINKAFLDTEFNNQQSSQTE